MIETYGLTHMALAVEDADRSLGFYRDVFGVEEYARENGRVHATTPGRKDVITFDENGAGAGERGGIIHFGFRLLRPGDIDEAVAAVERAGGRVISRGEFSPGFPYAYVEDPDGYEVEIWYE
jgi:catechol 2,3-dioxygenase-like lactoylglutathione lyase family enzyme